MVNRQKLKNSIIKNTYRLISKVSLHKLLALRALIYEVGETLPAVGQIMESLKWGQPSYVPINKSGTPIRLGAEKKSAGTVGLYVNCSTNLIETVKHMYCEQLKYDGNRGILFHEDDALPEDKIRHIIEMALTYHLD